jgi:hypothetical protein
MDPIHPIVPQAPVIPPVGSTPAITRAQEQAQKRRHEAADREAADRERRRNRERDDPYEDPEDGEDDDGRPHVDLTV